MLHEFLCGVANNSNGRLAIAVPYVDKGVAKSSGAWSEMKHQEIDLVLVTGGADAEKAWTELRDYPWRSILICQSRALHAKLYSFVSGNGHGSCLIGSHNLTIPGLRRNFEAGVLLRSNSADREMQDVVLACQQQVLDLAAQGKVFIDTTKWPDLNESESRGGCHD